MTKTRKKKENSSGTGIERRRARRRPILATFSVYLVIPKKGLYKLMVHDLSELGIGFDIDVEGESSTHFPVKVGDIIESRLYLNQSLFIPLALRVARVDEKQIMRRVGAEFHHQNGLHFKALLALLDFLDRMADALNVDAERRN